VIIYILSHVIFPWRRDVGALSRNNGIVQHCCASLATQQFWKALASLADKNVNKQHCYARNNRQAFLWLWDGCLRPLTDIGSVFWESLEYRRACVSGYGLPLVGRLSSYWEIARGARELIPWTVKTFDRRG
jgi:hypothetical protein